MCKWQWLPLAAFIVSVLTFTATADELLEDEDELSVHEHAPPPAAAGEMADPWDDLATQVLTTPALFTHQLQVEFEATQDKRWLVIERGDTAEKVITKFARENGMGDEQARLAGRAVAKAQLQMAWASERSRRADQQRYLDQPALFNLTMSVRQDEKNDTLIPIPISAGQSPIEAVDAFAEQHVKLSNETAQLIAERMSDDQRNLAWDVANEQFGPNASVYKYLESRLQLLKPAELLGVAKLAKVRRDDLALFTLFIECGDTCPEHSFGPIESTAFEGDEVHDLVHSIATRAGKIGAADEASFVQRVSGAILVAFHNYKTLREKLGVDENNKLTGPVKYWYDERSDSFKDPRTWETAPPRSQPLFQLTYVVDTPSSPEDATGQMDGERMRQSLNVTVYEGDVAVDLGERLAAHYKIDQHAGWAFAQYVASSWREVRARLKITQGARPWEEAPPEGMALFTMDIAGQYDSISNTAAPLVVHEGDGPKHLARQCLAYYRRVECERKAATAPAAAEGGEHAVATVSAKVKGQCESESATALDVEQVDALSKAVTAQFKKYFEHS